MGRNLQEKIEEDTYYIINEIADELDLDIPFYPEVYWIGGDFKFDSLGLHERERDNFEYRKRNKCSSCFHTPNIILIANKHLDITAEEAGHFLHFANSKLQFNNKNHGNHIAISSIVEMVGYFCSKLIHSDRKNKHVGYPDIVDDRDNCLEKIAREYMVNSEMDLNEEYPGLSEERQLVKFAEDYIDTEDFQVYQQGYGMGEGLYNAYISGLIPAKQIKELMLKDFEKENEAVRTFFKLKYNTLNYPKK